MSGLDLKSLFSALLSDRIQSDNTFKTEIDAARANTSAGPFTWSRDNFNTEDEARSAAQAFVGYVMCARLELHLVQPEIYTIEEYDHTISEKAENGQRTVKRWCCSARFTV